MSIIDEAQAAIASGNPVKVAWGREQLQRSSAGDPATAANTSVGPTPGVDAGPSNAPIAGLGAAAPTSAPAGGGGPAPVASGAGSTGVSNPDDPNTPTVFSGPNILRQGIGQRNPPNLMPALTGLRNIY